MRKIIIILGLLFSVSMFAQSKAEIDNIEKQNKENDKKIKDFKKEVRRMDKQLEKLAPEDTTLFVIYDFSTGKYISQNLKPRNKRPVVFKIININRLAYDVTFKVENIIITDEFFNQESVIVTEKKNEELNRQLVINEKNIPKPTIDANSLKEGYKASAVDLTADAAAIRKLKDTIDEKKQQIRQLNFDIEKINFEMLKKESDTIMRNQIQSKNFKKDSINALLTYKEKKLNDKETEFNRKKGVVYYLNETYKKLYEKYKDVVLISQELIQAESECDFFKQSVALLPTLTDSVYKKSKNEKDCVLLKIDAIKNSIKEYNKKIDDFYSYYTFAINDWEAFDQIKPEVIENIRLRYQIVKDEVDNIKEVIANKNMPNQLIELEVMDKILSNPDSYEVFSAPVQALQDYIAFDVEIKGKNKALSSKLKNEKIYHVEYARKGVRFDFSVGTVFDFQLDKNDNDDDDYYSEYAIEEFQVEGVSYKKIVGVSRDSFKPSLAGMFHTSFRTAGTCSFGLTLGASLNVETFDLNSLFPGVSLLVGKDRKFIFTLGAAFKKVDLLKKNYSLNHPYSPDTFNEGTELTSSQYKIGLFFGITYNLTKAQRGKIKI